MDVPEFNVCVMVCTRGRMLGHDLVLINRVALEYYVLYYFKRIFEGALYLL